MKKNAVIAVLAAGLALSLSGCALLGKKEPPPALQFSYSTSNGPAAGLVRAFVMNGSTVLQFIDLSQAQPKVYAGGQDTPLPYQVVGQYAIVSGVHPMLRVAANGATAIATATNLQPEQLGAFIPPAPVAAAAPIAAPDPLTLQLQETRQRLDRARRQVADLEREIAGAATITPAANIQPAPLIVPAGDTARAWTLEANKTLKDNLADFARTAGYAEPNWKAANPYMITQTASLNGTFVEVVGKIAQQVPTLDIRIYPWKRSIDVVEASN